MERKDSSLPRMVKTLASQQQTLSFKVRPNLSTKDKQNKLEKSLHQAMARNIVKKAKSFNSPDLIFALNDSIRLETSTTDIESELKLHREHSINKTFHGFSIGSQVQKTQKKFYAVNQQRQKAIELSKWVTEKLSVIKSKKNVTLEDILDYNQTVINFGLGEVIETVRRRCKQEGQVLKILWDNTFLLFEGLLNVLAEQLKQKNDQLIKNQKELQKIYLTHIEFANKKNKQLEEHLDLLYEKMKKIILWNRSLRKDRYKQEVNIRIKDYRLGTYSSALQEATAMLLAQSKEKDCLKLARKIISKLYQNKNMTYTERRKKKHKSKTLQNQAHQHVHEKAKQFVTNWLKKYSFEEDEKIQNALYLTQDQKLQLIKMADQKEAADVDIYDFFQTKSIKIQATFETTEIGMQYQINQVPAKTKNIGIETKPVFTRNMGTQLNYIEEEDNLKIQRSTKRGLKRNLTFEILKESKNSRTPKNGLRKIDKKKSLNNSSFQNQKYLDDVNENMEQIKSNQFNETLIENSLEDSEQYMSKQQWQTKNEIIDLCDPIAEMSLEKIEYEDQQQFKKNGKIQIKDLKLGNSSNEKYLHPNSEINRNKMNLKEQIIKKNGFSQRFITEKGEEASAIYRIKSLKKQKFEEAYKKEMKNQYNENKEELIRAVVRSRSFYKANRSRDQNNQKNFIFLWYRPNKTFESKIKKQLNQMDENIYNYFGSLIKSLSLPYNYTKSKIYNQTCALFSSISTNLSNVQRSIPKNKQFIHLSVTGISKFISRLIFDYLRKIRGDAEGIYVESERVYYSLSVILVDHMMHKYGLKEIAEKKLKDFMEKLSNFVGVSERINFFYRLLGVSQELMSADQLIIYMKCLVNFDLNKTIPIHNISKDFTVQRALTDRETVIAHVDQIIKEFFREDRRQQVKWKIQRYFYVYQLNGLFDIERIATMIIDEYINFKKEDYQKYVPIYKNCQGNFFPNLLKILQIYCGTENLPPKFSKMIQQMFKNADLLDENYGKSISEIKFVGLCSRLGFPQIDQINQKMTALKNEMVNATKISPEFSVEGHETINRIKRKYNVKISLERESPDYWVWTCAQIGYDIPMINTFGLLGNLRHFNVQPAVN